MATSNVLLTSALSNILPRICTKYTINATYRFNKTLVSASPVGRIFDHSVDKTIINFTTQHLRKFQNLRLLSLNISVSVNKWFCDLWESILRAVPKKKTSHSKKRSRQRAGKALKDVTALNKCSGCGHVKRSHVLCPYCVKEIQGLWKKELHRASASKPIDP